MWWTIVEIIVPLIGLVTATTRWNRLQNKRKLFVLGCLTVGIISLPIRSHFETAGNEETIEDLRTQVGMAEQKLVENDMIRKKIVEYGDIAKLNADGSTGLVKKGGGLTGGDTAITPKAEKIWIYSGENKDTRHPKCDMEGIKKAKQIIGEHPTFPFSYYVLAACHKEKGEQMWITYSQRDLEILEFTTQVPAHNRHHDTVRQRLEDWMRQTQDSPTKAVEVCLSHKRGSYAR